MHRREIAACLCACLATSMAPAEGEREKRVLEDRSTFLSRGRWIYNDLEKGFAEARESGKPMIVAFRCIPCQACRGFDEQLAGEDARISGLLDRFVRVRIPQANGADLSLFQLDFDLSFYAVFLNADRTIYGRFGTRTTQEDKKGDVSMEAFREALESVLALHERFPAVRPALAGKTGPAPRFKVPEDYPSLQGKYKPFIDYESDAVRSCLHCHQVRDAERLLYRERREPIPDDVLYPFPLPDVIGLELDPRRRATVASVVAGSAVERAGFAPQDDILSFGGQPVVSIADVQWVLHRSGDEGKVAARVRRAGAEVDLEIALEKSWRRRSDISWRASSWELRRMGTGGILLVDLGAEERRRLGIADGALALFAKHVGEYGEHATAKRAGVRNGDVIISVDGNSARMSESELFGYTVQKKLPGDTLKITVLRDGARKELSFQLQ